MCSLLVVIAVVGCALCCYILHITGGVIGPFLSLALLLPLLGRALLFLLAGDIGVRHGRWRLIQHVYNFLARLACFRLFIR